MHLIPIHNIHDETVAIYHQFRENAFKTDGSFVADSPKVVNLLLTHDIKAVSILATQEYYDLYYTTHLAHRENLICYVATKAQMQSIVGHTLHHNVMMHGIRPKESTLASLGDHVIMLDEISSTENIGAIARSAAALGMDSYLIPKRGPHPYARRALRVSMGHIALLKLHCYEEIISTITALRILGYHIYAAEVTKEATPLQEVKIAPRWVLLMGHEGKGISKEILDACDEVIKIEMMEGIKSFNVGVAASIMMYQFKQRP